jgi:hypothetical protein
LIFENAYTSDPYIVYLLNLHPRKNGLSNESKINDLLVWDFWYSNVQENITLDVLKSDSHLKKAFQINDKAGDPIYVGFIKVN